MSLHHSHDAVCPLCEAKLLDADPVIAGWFRRVKARYPNVHVYYAYRGPEEQARVVAEGKSKLTYPHSKHNAVRDGKPCSLALDLFQIDEDGIGRFARPFYAKVAADAWENTDPVIWGGDWNGDGVQEKSDWDGPHFELKSVTS